MRISRPRSTGCPGLDSRADDQRPQISASSRSFRAYSKEECTQLDTGCRGFIAFLEGSGVLNPLMREIIIERAMALSERPTDIVEAQGHRADRAVEPASGPRHADSRRAAVRRRGSRIPLSTESALAAGAALFLSSCPHCLRCGVKCVVGHGQIHQTLSPLGRRTHRVILSAAGIPTMAKQLIIAEKPSVAQDIARALGGFTKSGDYFESDDYVLSSAVGHLAGAHGSRRIRGQARQVVVRPSARHSAALRAGSRSRSRPTGSRC